MWHHWQIILQGDLAHDNTLNENSLFLNLKKWFTKIITSFWGAHRPTDYRPTVLFTVPPQGPHSAVHCPATHSPPVWCDLPPEPIAIVPCHLTWVKLRVRLRVSFGKCHETVVGDKAQSIDKWHDGAEDSRWVAQDSEWVGWDSPQDRWRVASSNHQQLFLLLQFVANNTELCSNSTFLQK